MLNKLVLMAVCFTAAGFADPVNLTSGPPFTFVTGSDLFVSFSVWNYAVNNRDSSPYPTSIGLQLLGAQPSVSKLNAVPNSSGRYFAGYLLEGWLENTAGTVSVPFTSPDAARLGLDVGALVLEPGAVSSSTAPMAVIEADAALTTTLSEQIFGSNIASRGSSAVIHLRNLGSDVQIGIPGSLSLLSAISEPTVSGAGPVRTSGITQSISVTSVPEPGTFLLLFLVSGAIAARSLMRLRKAPAVSKQRS